MLNELLKEAIDETKLSVADCIIHFAAMEPVKVYAGREKIGPVILNLLSNALKYSPKGGRIDVECGVAIGKAQVRVKDLGIGIKNDHLVNCSIVITG